MRRAWLVVVAATACGGNRAKIAREMQPFDCRNRLATYVAHKPIQGDEAGVSIDCADAGPRLSRWKTVNGKRTADERHLQPIEFDKIWSQIDATGWPLLKDCTNGSLGKRDPIFTFEVHDDQNASKFKCQTLEVPYPYFDLVNPLDAAANEGRKDLGGDDDVDKPDQRGKMK
jgi:hypothetical protein